MNFDAPRAAVDFVPQKPRGPDVCLEIEGRPVPVPHKVLHGRNDHFWMRERDERIDLLRSRRVRELRGWRRHLFVWFGNRRWARRLIGGYWELWKNNCTRSLLWVPFPAWPSNPHTRPWCLFGEARAVESWDEPLPRAREAGYRVGAVSGAGTVPGSADTGEWTRLVEGLPSAPKKGDLVDLDAVFERLQRPVPGPGKSRLG